jgi:hypothetical protein
MMTTEQIKLSILSSADMDGRIIFGDSPPVEAVAMVCEGRLIRLSYFVFTIAE